MTAPDVAIELPPLPPIDPEMSLPYSAIRYVAGYPENYLRKYAEAFGQECARAAVAAEREEAAKSAGRWRWLAELHCNSFSLGRDENHACNYVTARKWIEEFCPDDFADVDPAELERMKAANTIWALQIYPHTPVGFNIWHGATAEYVIDAAMADYAAAIRKGA